MAGDGLMLGVGRRPAGGWDQLSASQVNHLVRKLAAVHGWRRLEVSMHPATWSQLAAHLNYNLSFPKPGVAMGGDRDVDPARVAVVFRHDKEG